VLLQQAEVKVVHMVVDMVAERERERERESSVRSSRIFRCGACPIGASRINRVLTETGVVNVSCDIVRAA
jgi:hypothetical protein